MTDEFYVGYLPGSAPESASFSRRFVLLLVAITLGIGALLVSSMGEFSKAVFEFGVEREFEGVLAAGPVPILSVERPGSMLAEPRTSNYLLVAFGKFGASAKVKSMSGRRVRLRGSLIYRDNQTMIEVVAGSTEDLGEPSPSAWSGEEEDLGVRSLVGEIVDSKCFLGVMKPGNLKPHRACAVRCISGGVPPVLLVRDENGLASYYLLLSATGETVNKQVLDLVAEPLQIEGRVVRRAGHSFLYADPMTYLPVR